MTDRYSLDSCPACGSNSFKEYLKTRECGEFDNLVLFLSKCSDCGLIFLKKTVQQEGLYPGCYYGKNVGFLNFLFNFMLNIFLSDRYKLIGKFSKRVGSILDIGCGDGNFLFYMKKRGWRVFGIDSSSAGTALAQEKDIPIITVDLSESNLSIDSQDVVTYWYSLEHLISPKESMLKTYNILKNDGILIISVQNIDSLQFALFKPSWFHLDLPRHVLHFTPSTLKRFLNSSGFDVINIRHDSLQMNFFGWYQSLFNLLGFPKNLFYKTVKRENVWLEKNCLLLILMLFIAPYVIILSLIFCIIEIVLKKGGVITAIARKKIR